MMDNFVCSECNKFFNYRKNLNHHVRTKHTNKNPKFSCDLCSFTSHTKYSLVRHKNSQHKTAKCEHPQVKCPLCVEECRTKSDMVAHFINFHEIRIANESLKFANEEDFLKWKSEKENEQVCEFVVCRSKYECKDGSSKMKYRCHRDGTFKSRGNHERHQKVLGSNKISGHCPAKIDVTFQSGEVQVSFCATHVGHQEELGRMRLSLSERNDLARKIAMKIPFDRILDEVRDSIGETGIERIHLLTRKDLFNIEQEYNLKSEAVHHENDCTSVESWNPEIDECGGIVRFQKGQNMSSMMYPQLKPEDEEKDIILKELHNPLKRRQSEDIEERKVKLREKFESILATIESPEHVDIIEKHLQPIIPAIQAHSTKAMINTAPSTSKAIKFETQRQLFSTKKPHKKTSSSLSRPTESEQQAVAADLLLH
ncbi:uncharacterized protein [Anabrus simplex]|uniref:uncharacterized protein n=1 Tax=Anabrus simplex TaxID=316456 RepID=UPI0035A3A895